MNLRRYEIIFAIAVICFSLWGQYKESQVNERLRAQVEVLQQNNEELKILLNKCTNECIERYVTDDKSERMDSPRGTTPPDGFMWGGDSASNGNRRPK